MIEADRPPSITPKTVSSSPVQLLFALGRRGITRQVTITTDEAIRVDTTSSVSATRGLLIPGQGAPFTFPKDIPAGTELWAIRAGSNDANVGIAVSLVNREAVST